MVDLGSLVLLMSIFGWKIAVVYVIVGLVIAIVGGTIIEKLHMEDQVAEFVKKAQNVEIQAIKLTFKERNQYAKEQVIETIKKVALYIVVGVGICLLYTSRCV